MRPNTASKNYIPLLTFPKHHHPKDQSSPFVLGHPPDGLFEGFPKSPSSLDASYKQCQQFESMTPKSSELPTRTSQKAALLHQSSQQSQ